MSDTRPATSPVSTDTNHVQLARGGGSVRDARFDQSWTLRSTSGRALGGIASTAPAGNA